MEDAPSPSVLCFDPKISTENFARLCQFLVTICSEVMRDILSHYIKPANLRSELDMNKSKLNTLNAEEKKLLYPPHSSTSCVPPIRSRDLDLSLLYKILRNICNIPSHKAGWGKQPDQGDFSLAACLERIRILRNSISGHSTNGTVNDVEFEDYWRDLRTSVVEIEREVIGSDRYERWIDHLYDCDLNPTKSKEYVAQIRRNTGEIILKRERIDLVEEEANAKRARLEKIEERQANLEEGNAKFQKNLEVKLSEVLTTILKELKATEMRLQKNKGFTNVDREAITRDTSWKMRRLAAMKIKPAVLRKRQVFWFSMDSTRENKCWLMVSKCFPEDIMASFLLKAQSSNLYLLSDVNVCKKIKIPKKYGMPLFSTNIATNEDGKIVFVSGKSLVAAGENGEFQKLFDISEDHVPSSRSVLCTSSGNYFIKGLCSAHVIEYNREGVCLRKSNLPPSLDTCISRLNQNNNQDFILTSHSPFSFLDHIGIFDESFRLKFTLDIELHGIITPLRNKSGDILYGHGQTIDLLDERGRFLKTVYKTRKHRSIKGITCSNNGTVWILYDTFRIDVFKLETPL